MKKNGFTLAEVLVTLGIIGVVAALTTPALIQNVGSAKVGPKLQKSVATFETAVEMMLTEENANSISSITSDTDEFGKKLGNYMKIDRVKDKVGYKKYSGSTELVSADTSQNRGATTASGLGLRYDSEDGVSYYIGLGTPKATVAPYEDIPNNQFLASMYIDVNGAQGPNRLGVDLFKFLLYNDGTLRPYGANGFYRGAGGNTTTWKNGNCDDSSVKNAEYCTGSIFENGMKIIYQ